MFAVKVEKCDSLLDQTVINIGMRPLFSLVIV